MGELITVNFSNKAPAPPPQAPETGAEDADVHEIENRIPVRLAALLSARDTYRANLRDLVDTITTYKTLLGQKSAETNRQIAAIIQQTEEQCIALQGELTDIQHELARLREQAENTKRLRRTSAG